MKWPTKEDPDVLYFLFPLVLPPKSAKTIAASFIKNISIPPCRVHEESDPPIG